MVFNLASLLREKQIKSPANNEEHLPDIKKVPQKKYKGRI